MAAGCEEIPVLTYLVVNKTKENPRLEKASKTSIYTAHFIKKPLIH